ncbi:ABC transporter substrate-binding protein [Streptomyces sp. NBC_00647]|uniref:ABC transporter substrate-binding protein n=1 Tax=Streptomyces sp. NBC_00647 TaxID=2975796 RepID=UPI00324376C6
MNRVRARILRRGAGAVVALGLLMGVTACDGGGSESSAAGRPQRGGTLSYGSVQQPQCLDPGFAPDTATGLIDRNIFDSLVSVGADGTTDPWLASGWKISANGRSYTFELRAGVTFQDGTPFTAKAVKATLDHAVDPKTKSLNAASLLSAYKGSTVLGSRSVRVDLTRPDAALLTSLGSPYLGIQAPGSLRGKPCLKPVGTGPFSFASWTPNKELVLKRNDAYQWAPPGTAHTGPAHLDGIRYQFVADDTARFGALTSGQLDVIENVPASNVKTLESSDTATFHKTDSPGQVYGLRLNSTRGPFTDERVRLAFMDSLDLDGLVKSVYFGQYERAWSPLSPVTRGYDASLEDSWRKDTARAARLLDEAGWTTRDTAGYRTKDGKRLTVHWRTGAQLDRDQRGTVAQGIQADAKKAGFDLRYETEDTGTFAKNILSGNLDIWAGSNQRLDPDILRSSFASYATLRKGGGNIFGLKNSRLDSLLDGAASTTDWKVRAKNYAEVQQYVVRHGLQVPVLVPANLLAAQKKVHGVTFNPDSTLRFYDLWLG